MRRRIIFGIVLVLVLMAAVRLVRLRRSQLMNQRVSTAAMIPVETGRVTRGDFSGELVCYGVIGSDRQAGIRSRVGGEVSAIPVREGACVVQGDTLLELDGTPDAPRGNRAAVQVAIRNLEQSVASLGQTRKNLKAVLDNDRMLHENDAISAQQVELSENRYLEAGVQLASLRSELAAQKAQLAQFTVTAPFDGVVARVQVQLGDMAAPMQPLVRVEDPTPCKVSVTVAAADLGRIRPGTPATLVRDGATLEATVGRVHPTAGAAGTGLVDILLPEPPFGLPLGASIEARLAVDTMAGVLLVPAESVLEGVRATRVHVVRDDTVRVVPVEILGAAEESIAVRGDLAPGDVLVLGSDSLLMRLAGGTRVAPRGETR